MKVDTLVYHTIPIADNDEPLVKLESQTGVRLFDRTLLPPDYTKDAWLRKSAAERLYAAGLELFNSTNGGFELYVKDGYRTIDCQRRIWNEGLERLTLETGDKDVGLATARILYSDPTGFDENNPATWLAHTPIHATGGAVDVFMTSNNEDRKAWICINEYPEKSLHYSTDYFENKENLNETEENVKNNRRLLVRVMESNGFVNYPNEAWHFDFGDQMHAYLSLAQSATYGYMKNPEK